MNTALDDCKYTKKEQRCSHVYLDIVIGESSSISADITLCKLRYFMHGSGSVIYIHVYTSGGLRRVVNLQREIMSLSNT